MKTNETSLPTPKANDPETLNAIVDTLGAVVMCLSKQLPPEGRPVLARDLARLSADATAHGRPLSGRLLADISRAAQL